MSIDPRRLRFLLAVARAGGVLAAADELAVTPSAVSQQLAKLEAETRRSLVRRTPTGTVLTDAGRLLVEAAEDIERLLQETETRLMPDDTGPAGTIRIGGFYSFFAVVLLPAFPEWRERMPRLQVELVEEDQDELLRRLRAGDIDVAVLELDAEETPRALPSRMTEIPLLDEPWQVVLPAGAVAAADPVNLSRLGLPWLGVHPSAAGAQALRRVRRATGNDEPTVHAYVETQTALALVAAGEGAALIPSLALRGPTPPGIETLDLPGIGHRRIVLRRYEGRRVPESVDLAASLVREAAAAISFESRS
ncbi:LysR family transcriptional regulator [Nocardioides caldifontis]|uniref:LysR family transcriptional regulator n=1 Tax=Nocardioides caldifontis TaxID=2588938 RepID=UPI0011E04D09|nr:LysR family transcriptional regulator [Nocardioides caldifontis]